MSGIINGVEGVKSTFSSWDSCMSKAYCKWPVIVGIIIGSLIVLSVLYCVVQILCCGAQCCFCFAKLGKCLCCGCCGDSRHSGRGDDHIKNNGYVRPTDYNNGYQPNFIAQGQYRSQAPPTYAASATAKFESPSKTARYQHEDALPAMPSWSDAQSRHVEDHSTSQEDVELGDLGHKEQTEPMLPKFETDDYKYGLGSGGHGPQSSTGDLALGAGALAAGGAAGAAAYRDNHSRQDRYSPTHGASQSPYNDDQQQGNDSYYGQAQSAPYGQPQRSPGYRTPSAQGYSQQGLQPTSSTGPYGPGGAGAAYPNSPRRPQPGYISPGRAQQSPTYPPQSGYMSPNRAQQQSPTYPPQQQSYSQRGPSPSPTYATHAPAQQQQQQQPYGNFQHREPSPSPTYHTNPPAPQQQSSYAAYPGRAAYQPAGAAEQQSVAGDSYAAYNPSLARKPVQGGGNNSGGW